MTEKQEVVGDEVETEELQEEAEPTKSQDKKYSDADVNRMIAKEKATWKRSHDKERETLSGAEADLREQLASRDEIIQQNVALLRKDLNIADDDWEFMSEGKDALAQYQFLLKKIDKSGKQDIPQTAVGTRKKPVFTSTFNANV